MLVNWKIISLHFIFKSGTQYAIFVTYAANIII